MAEYTIVEGNPGQAGGAYAIVAARFNAFVVEQMLDGTLAGLKQQGISAENITVSYVPGAYELPLAVQALAETGRFDGIIALGAVIRGATAHFDYVAGEASRGINQVMLETRCPVAFGVLTTDTVDQALERADTEKGNKGFDAAMAVLEMADLLKQIKGL